MGAVEREVLVAMTRTLNGYVLLSIMETHRGETTEGDTTWTTEGDTTWLLPGEARQLGKALIADADRIQNRQ